MTNDLNAAKAVVADFTERLDSAAPGEETRQVCARYMADAHGYRGVRPFYEIPGTAALADTVYSPLKAAMTTSQRRLDMLFASRDHLKPDGAIWVVSMGHLLGDMTGDWLGIPAQERTVFLPYATMHRVDAGKIAETVEFWDVLAVLTQAGRNPYAAHQSGAHLMSPGPKTHDGLGLHAAQETAATHKITTEMLADLAKSYTSPSAHMTRFWHPDMNWFGPSGIGASLGFPGYRRGHTDPFEEKLNTTDIIDWELACAEGNFSAVMWWPCLRMQNIGGYMGVPANDARAEMRVLDLYRRQGDKLAENWIFIDMLHFLAAQGVDLLETGQ